ncbi:MAG: RNA methyltransferase [Actinomycetaceae bacterium]|nr:RNA methyltransferase [Actinomycetaceae bacterium]
MAESTKVIMRAIQEGHQPRSFLVVEKWIKDIEPWVEEATGAKDGGDIPIFIGTEDMLRKIAGYHMHRGAMASMHRPPLVDVRDAIHQARGGSGARRIFVLEALVDHTNIGAIFRSAAALGVDLVLVTDDCADPFYRRSVRVSMGTVFQVPWTRIHNWPSSIDVLKEEGFVTAALALNDEAIVLDEFSQMDACNSEDSRVALILGTEGDGLKQRTIAQSDYSVIIPMAGHVDSLNVAAASAVAAWQLRVRDS